MKQTFVRMTYDPKKEEIHVEQSDIKGLPLVMSDLLLLKTYASGIVDKLNHMPLDPALARKMFDTITGEMQELFDDAFASEETKEESANE